MIVEGWRKRQIEHSLNNLVHELDIYGDREDWERRRFSGEGQDFCFGLVKCKMPSRHSVENVGKAAERMSLELLGKIWV